MTDFFLPIPIYTSRGDAEAFLAYPYLYNRNGEWIGWVTPKREVYSVLGDYVGELTPEPRILRRRVIDPPKTKLRPPEPPQKMSLPTTVRLAPLMAELSFSLIDVLLDEPERLHTSDSGDLRQDVE